MKRRERAVRLLPPPIKRLVKDARSAVDPIYVHLCRKRAGYEGVIPPGSIRARAGWLNVHSYVVGGRRTADELETALAVAGKSFADFGSILDFGASSGRVLPHVVARGREEAEFHGCDVDEEAIRWASRNRPEASWSVNAAEPPLPFADDSFDLVYAVSVFTHLDERLQFRWLEDIRRVLQPQGLALLTTHGEDEFDAYRTLQVVSHSPDCARRVALRGSLSEEGFVHEPYTRSTWTAKDLPGTDESFGLAFHSEDYIRERWAERFEVLQILPRALALRQDIVVLRKPTR
ncbi:MAG: class I SAM-dependent methyltransferase [Actinobacteria bacterium]|nr:class I SAM-dependent methyltransferase [Actinomycetota bacterium]